MNPAPAAVQVTTEEVINKLSQNYGRQLDPLEAVQVSFFMECMSAFHQCGADKQQMAQVKNIILTDKAKGRN